MRILSTGGPFNEKQKEKLSKKIKTIFQTVCNACLAPNCPPAHHVLLLKIVFWASALNELNYLIEIDKVVILLRMWLKSNSAHKYVVGLAIVHILINKHFNSFERSLLTEIEHVSNVLNQSEWARGIHNIFSSDVFRNEYLLIYCIQDKTFSLTHYSINYLILLC